MLIAALALATEAKAVGEEKVLSDLGGLGGCEPFGGMVSDAQGNLYGTGSALRRDWLWHGFRTNSAAGGSWNEAVLHSFTDAEGDGGFPGRLLTLDAAGNVYGVTTMGGSYNCGMVFELQSVSGMFAIPQDEFTALPSGRELPDLESYSKSFPRLPPGADFLK